MSHLDLLWTGIILLGAWKHLVVTSQAHYKYNQIWFGKIHAAKHYARHCTSIFRKDLRTRGWLHHQHIPCFGFPFLSNFFFLVQSSIVMLNIYLFRYTYKWPRKIKERMSIRDDKKKSYGQWLTIWGWTFRQQLDDSLSMQWYQSTRLEEVRCGKIGSMCV